MEKLRESPVGCGVLTERTGFPGSMIRDLRADIGLDPGTDVNGLTVYGLEDQGASHLIDSVLLISATSAADKLPEFMREAHPESFEIIREQGATLLSWTVEDTRWYLSVRTPEDPVERVVVMSRGRERVAAAIAVLDGSRPGLTGGPRAVRVLPAGLGAGTQGGASEGAKAGEQHEWPLDQEPAKGSILFLAAGRSMWGSKGESSPALKSTRGMVIELGERHDDAGDRWTQLSAKMRMENEQAAEQMVSVAKGAVSFLALSAQQAESPESCCKALNEAMPTRVGTEVTVDLKVNSRDLATILDTVRTVHSPNAAGRRERTRGEAENRDTDRERPAKNPLSGTPSRR